MYKRGDRESNTPLLRGALLSDACGAASAEVRSLDHALFGVAISGGRDCFACEAARNDGCEGYSYLSDSTGSTAAARRAGK